MRELAKSYRSIRTDIQPLIEQLQSGQTPGDRIVGVKYQVFKVRLKNSNIQKGKSSGYRVIYYLKTEQNIILATIYSKSNLSDVSNKIVCCDLVIQCFYLGQHFFHSSQISFVVQL